MFRINVLAAVAGLKFAVALLILITGEFLHVGSKIYTGVLFILVI